MLEILVLLVSIIVLVMMANVLFTILQGALTVAVGVAWMLAFPFSVAGKRPALGILMVIAEVVVLGYWVVFFMAHRS